MAATLSILRNQAPCLCMFHWGEFAQVECTLDPAITRQNRAALAN